MDVLVARYHQLAYYQVQQDGFFARSTGSGVEGEQAEGPFHFTLFLPSKGHAKLQGKPMGLDADSSCLADLEIILILHELREENISDRRT